MVNKAISNAKLPANAKTHQSIFMRYAKFSNHLFIKYQATGEAMIKATKTSFRKSFESKPTIPETEAPSTFRIPISLVLRTTTKAINPHKPMQQINMDMAENALKRL